MKADAHKDGIASLIVEIGHKAKKADAEPEAEEHGESSDLELAMQELGERLTAKDYAGAAKAFAMACELHGYGPEASEPDSDD